MTEIVTETLKNLANNEIPSETLNLEQDFGQTDVYKNLVKKLKENLKTKNIKQKTLAKKLSITQASLSNLLSGKCNLSLDQFIKLTQISGTNFIELYKDAYSDSLKQIKLSLADEKTLYSNNYAFLIWCMLARPMSKNEIINKTNWSVENINTALELLTNFQMIDVDYNGNISQSQSGNTFIQINPLAKKEWERMTTWHINNLVVPEFDEYKKMKIPEKEGPREFKFSYNLYFNLKDEQREEMWKSLSALYERIQEMVQQNNLEGYTNDKHRLVQIKLLMFDYFNEKVGDYKK